MERNYTKVFVFCVCGKSSDVTLVVPVNEKSAVNTLNKFCSENCMKQNLVKMIIYTVCQSLILSTSHFHASHISINFSLSLQCLPGLGRFPFMLFNQSLLRRRTHSSFSFPSPCSVPNTTKSGPLYCGVVCSLHSLQTPSYGKRQVYIQSASKVVSVATMSLQSHGLVVEFFFVYLSQRKHCSYGNYRWH